MALAVGDGPITFDGQEGTVVATTATLDANGRGSLTFGGNTFQFRCLKETATPTPLVATADTYLRIGLLQQTANPLLFVLVFDDLPAPGRGRWIQGPGGSWQESWAFAGLDSVLFITDWKPGRITVSVGGVAAANVFCDVVYTHSTSDGTHECWHAPTYPYNGLQVVGGVPVRDSAVKLGSFKTDANGVLWAHRPDGTLEPITFPRYLSAIGQRASDTYPSMPNAERLLTKAEVFYLQESVEIAEGTAAALDTAAVTITITGPPGGVAVLYWEGSLQFGVDTLDGSGTAVRTGLPPGRYVGYCGHPTDSDKGVARATVTITQSGGSGTLAFAGTWTTSVGGTNGIVYAYDDVPCAGAEVWSFKGAPLASWQLVGTTAADGSFGPVALGPDLSMIYHPTYGAAMIDYGIVAAIWWDPVLSVRCGAYTVSDLPTVTQGIVPWGVAGGHNNLPPMARAGYIKSQTTGAKYYFSSGTACGTISEPFPVWLPVANWQSLIDPSPSGPYLYDSYDADDISLGAIVSGSSDQTTPPWADPISCPWYHALYYGAYLVAVLGGKQNGVIAEYALSILTKGVLREPERYGLETGKRVSPLEVRSRSATVEAQQTGASLALTFCSWEDEYCGGPAWVGPDAEGYVRSYCVQCADYGISTDCRTYFSTKTLGAYADWSTRVVKNTSAGGHVDRLVTGWPRPEEYAETNDYLQENWQGLGLDRWVAVHITLGTWNDTAFADGESIADAEARLGRTVGPVMLKVSVSAPVHECWVWVLAQSPSGLVRGLWVHVRDGDIGPYLLNAHPHDMYPNGYYTDVLNMGVYGLKAREPWHPTQDYPLGELAVYEGIAWAGLCSKSVTAFWEDILGVPCTEAFRNAIESGTIEEVYATAPPGATVVTSKPISQCPLGSIVLWETHAAILHHHGPWSAQSGEARLASTNADGNMTGFMRLWSELSHLTFQGWVEPPPATKTGIYATVVNDGPAWHSSAGVEVTHQAYSPFACDPRLSVRDPFLATDFLGQAHLVYIRDGQVMHAVYNEHSGIDTPVSVTHSAGVYTQHEQPSLVCCDDGRLLVAATSGGATRLYASFDGGFSWFQGGV